MSKCFVLCCTIYAITITIDYLHANLRFGKKKLLHQNWHTIEWNYINVFQMLNRGQGHSKKAHFSSFCSLQEYQLPFSGTRQQCSNVFILLFGKMKFKTLEVPDWFQTCKLCIKKIRTSYDQCSLIATPPWQVVLRCGCQTNQAHR